MQILRPSDWPAALALRAERPDALPIAGGTDVMVALEVEHRRPAALLDLSGALGRGCRVDEAGQIRIEAGTTYTMLAAEGAGRMPELARLAGRVGSRQVRNRGTVGGSLGSATETGDLHPLLLAADASIELASVQEVRTVPATDFYQGGRRTELATDELVAAVLIPSPIGPQRFFKICRRQAMARASCSVVIVLDAASRRVAVGIGAFGDRPARAFAAERFLSNAWQSAAWLYSRDVNWQPDPAAVTQFGRLVASELHSVEDVRTSAAYRRRVLAVLAGRALLDAWAELAVWSPVAEREGG